ncbi:Uncharacterized membrane protein YhfC [[Clostridium] ultunense Esp]|uniref:YhfC family intramembrane metalloprotease n=1 Tax=Thermicanus aegyptius TaxID=94009 RepID=UPI0002B70749|nr:YhfC family glutamic-type intramembrane protease [Thermicanus aegyptius]CCQ97052.1 Uncharacterized membrane protein YhfC [[Clostridium] ultunense Esp]
MVSTASIIGLALQALLSFTVPLFLLIYLIRKEKISIRTVFIGALVFILFSQILEKSMHLYLLVQNQTTANFFKQPFLYALYGGLAAGIFEEVGRYLAFRYALKGKMERKEGLALGLGHGGIEAVLIGGLPAIQAIFLSMMINQGTLESSLNGQVPAEMIASIKTSLTVTPPYLFYLGGMERMIALIIQIAMSLLVLLAVRKRNLRYLLYAIFAHAAIDFPVGLSQAFRIHPVWVEAFLLLVGIGLIYWILSTRKWKDEFSRI